MQRFPQVGPLCNHYLILITKHCLVGGKELDKGSKMEVWLKEIVELEKVRKRSFKEEKIVR